MDDGELTIVVDGAGMGRGWPPLAEGISEKDEVKGKIR